MVFLFSCAVFVSAALTASVLATMTVHEERTLPSNFVASGIPANDIILNLRAALTAVNMAGLETVLYDVSTPGSPLYGQHLSQDEVKAYASPSPDTVNAVTAWLQESDASNITIIGTFGDWISFSADLSTANSLLNANFETFTHTETGTTMIRTLSYSLPQDLLQHIDLIHPTTSFAHVLGKPQLTTPIPSNVTARAYPGAASFCSQIMQPTCFQDLYDIPFHTDTAQNTTQIAVSGFNEQYPNEYDLYKFLLSYTSVDPEKVFFSTTFSSQTIDGGEYNPQSGNSQDGGVGAGVEATFDVQYTVGLATNVPVVFWSVGNETSDGVGGFIDLIDALNAETDPPQVFTTSYGFNEDDLGATLAIRACNAYMTLGARGISILFASGDGGVSGGASQTCTTFVPTFPSTCPYVTSVGATEPFWDEASDEVLETAASFSSGGFSNVFSAPSYQAANIASYLTTLETIDSSLSNSVYNVTGRAYPDISAAGVEVSIILDGAVSYVTGTSCAAPVIASIIALINNQLVAAGKPVLGFLNPFLYANPTTLFDIVSGSNPGCDTDGFPATIGWDPVTGLGSPSMPNLAAAAGV